MNNERFAADVEKTYGQLQPMISTTLVGLGKGSATPQIMKFYGAFDELSAQSKGSVNCKPGCSYCCHYRVMVSAAEAFALVEALSKIPPGQRLKIESSIKSTAVRVATMTPDEYEHTNVPCAMLKDGNCSTYAARPLACRGHHATDVAPCKETFDNVNSSAMAPKDYSRQLAFRVFENAQLAFNHYTGLDTTRYEMHAALSEAISNSVSFKRWKAGKSAFPGVTDKVTLEEMMRRS
jgi:Fe-S-cluster containining protein